MGDVRIIWDPATARGDLNMVGGAIELGHDLETAVLISVFTDLAADPDDILLPGQAADPRGWWADSLTGDPIGTKLWQIFARTTSQDTLNWARDQVSKALTWMIADGVAAAVEVDAQYIARGALGLRITITEPSGRRTAFSYAWDQEK
jgi:phage gp46-like protein